MKKSSKKKLCAFMVLSIIMIFATGCKSRATILQTEHETTTQSEIKGDNKKEPNTEVFGKINFDTDLNEADFGYTAAKGCPLAAVKIKGYGCFVIRLRKDLAPATVDNFIDLVKSGFYDGSFITNSFYGHSFRCGDRTGTGDGGAEHTIKGEPYGDGERKLAGYAGKSGAVSMFRGDITDYDCASSQFIVMIGNDPSYNGTYCQFGEVIYGMDELRKLNKDNFGNIESEETAKLKENLVIEKILVDMNEG